MLTVPRRVLAFDLDGTLAVSKSPISESIASLLGDTLGLFDVCVISGGRFEQFEEQLINRLHVEPRRLARLHLMPTSGARYFRFLEAESAWVQQYGEDLTPDQKNRIIAVLTEGSKHLGYGKRHLTAKSLKIGVVKSLTPRSDRRLCPN